MRFPSFLYTFVVCLRVVRWLRIPLILQTEKFLRNIRWRVFWFERRGVTEEEPTEHLLTTDATVDFKTTKTPPQHELLKLFERDIYSLIGNIQFSSV